MKTRYFLALLLFIIGAASCTIDDQKITDNPEDGTVSISLLINDQEVVETRSTASTNERTIDDAYLLNFGSDGYYKSGQKIPLTAITNNGDKEPSIKAGGIGNGDIIVLLCNTGITTLPSLSVGSSTVSDINSAFPSHNWNINQNYPNSGKGMPMSGTLIWNSSSPETLVLTRSVAKIQLAFDIPAGEDITSSFDMYSATWGLFYAAEEGNIYAEGMISIPWTNTFSNYSTLSKAIVGSSSENEVVTEYLPEYRNSEFPKGSWEAIDKFNKNRTCLLLHTTAGFYRLDIATGNPYTEAKKFLDIERNSHYIVTVKKVKSFGYATADEALANPSSNLEYQIKVFGGNDNYSDTNGQYVVSTDEQKVKIFKEDNYLLKISLTTPQAVELTTACVDIVGPDKTTPVTIPECFEIDGNKAVSNMFSLGTQTTSAEFVLNCEAIWSDVESLKELAGNYIRIKFGNITKYVLIEGVTTNEDGNIALYYGHENCIELPTNPTTKTFDVTPYSTLDKIYGHEDYFDSDMCTPRSAAMLWSDVSKDHLTGITLNAESNSKFSVTFNSNGKAGNAVIAIYDTESPDDPNARILWSYHIWINDRDEMNDERWSTFSTVSRAITKNRYILMDRNLGATSNNMPTAANSYDHSAYGLLYQWGRKDPFVGASKYRGTTVPKTQYKPNGETTSLTTAVNSATVGTIGYATEHPTTFILKFDSSEDWLYKRNPALWGNPSDKTSIVNESFPAGQKSIYDPCPEGYCVPAQNAFVMTVNPNTCSIGNDEIALNASWNTAPASYGGLIYYQDVGVGKTTYLPFAGGIRRDNGVLSGMGGEGFYWTNSNLKKNNANAGSRASFGVTSWNPIWGGGRGIGSSVRCMRVVE